MNAKYERILDLEAAVKASRLSAAFTLTGVSDYQAGQNATAVQSDKAKLAAAIDALTVEEMAEFGAYRMEFYR